MPRPTNRCGGCWKTLYLTLGAVRYQVVLALQPSGQRTAHVAQAERVLLPRVHALPPVLAGYVLGAAWVASMIALFNLWRRESGRHAVDPVGGLEPENAGRLDPRSSGSEAA
jgi:hypothetical protein